MILESRKFRNALGRFATGVCIVAAYTKDGQPWGMTINSFSSVSLDPQLILWSLQKDSKCFSVFNEAQKFSINILTLQQQELANKHAQRDQHLIEEGTYRHGRTGCIVLNHVMTAFECRQHAVHDGGDHIIIVGEVMEMMNHPANRKPLLFFGGRYCEPK